MGLPAPWALRVCVSLILAFNSLWEKTPENSKKRNGLFAGLSGEDLLLLGIILLLSQEDAGDEILPILLMLLFFRK